MSKKTIVMAIIGMFLLTSIATLPGVSMSTVETKRDLAPGLAPPDGSITLEPEEPNRFGWYDTPVVVTFHAKDDIKLYYIHWQVITNDVEGPWEKDDVDPPQAEYDFPITLNKDGKHEVKFQAEDHVGNRGSIHSTYALGWPYYIQIDMTPPTITLEIEKIKITEYKITAVMEDAISGVYWVQFYLDDESERLIVTPPYQYTYEVKLLDGIKKTVKAEVCDYAENTASTSENIPYSINIDTQQPADLRSFLQRVSSSGASNYESENPNLLGEIPRKIFTSRTPTTASSLINTIFNKLLSL